MRHLLQTMINALLSADADAVASAERGKSSPDGLAQRNGYRHRELDARAGTIDIAIPKLRAGTYFPDWLMERRKRAEAAMITVVADRYLARGLHHPRNRQALGLAGHAGYAGYGYCVSHSRYFWGFRLYLLSTPEGMPVIWGMANPRFGEREVTEALLRHDHHLVHDKQVILADKGFERFITEELGAHLVRPDCKDENPSSGNSASSVSGSSRSSTASRANSDSNTRAHGPSTCFMPASPSKFLALSAGIWHNWKTHEPRKCSLTAYDH